MAIDTQTFGTDVWGANDVQRIVERNAEWLTKFIVAGVKAVMKDGRPLFTDKVPESDRLAALLTAPPQFWEALQASDPETAANLVAMVIRARQKGKIPAEGPLADQVPPEEPGQQGPGLPTPQQEAEQIGKPGTGTERDRPIPSVFTKPNDFTSG